MALINCVQCGANISEKAVKCPKCGNQTPFEESFSACVECSANIPKDSDFCPECGLPKSFNQTCKENSELKNHETITSENQFDYDKFISLIRSYDSIATKKFGAKVIVWGMIVLIGFIKKDNWEDYWLSIQRYFRMPHSDILMFQGMVLLFYVGIIKFLFEMIFLIISYIKKTTLIKYLKRINKQEDILSVSRFLDEYSFSNNDDKEEIRNVLHNRSKELSDSH